MSRRIFARALALGTALALVSVAHTAYAQETGSSFGGSSFHEHHETSHEHHEPFHESRPYRSPRSPTRHDYRPPSTSGSPSRYNPPVESTPEPLIWPAGDHGRRLPSATERALMRPQSVLWVAWLIGIVTGLGVLGVGWLRSRRG